MDFTQQVAVITGGAQGIGQGFAEVLLSHGSKVCVCDVNIEQGEKSLQEFQSKYGKEKVIFVKCDVTVSDDVKNVFEKTKQLFGKITIVANCAGILGEENWQRTVKTNLLGVMEGSYLGIQYMSREHGGEGGVVVNMGSEAGLNAYAVPAYCASKFGVVGFTRSLAQIPSNKENGLRFVCVCPAWVNTAMFVPSPQAQSFVDQFGLLEVSDVAKVFEEVLSDPTKDVCVIQMSKVGGTKFID